ncbi:hypothetical protein V4F39_23620 [Aquincola sp. MAHUQ-54]|uniref:Secreted protein n=1 Tax=Aquincola agrisoli TaxID=3119538 RepID=A0AAW9QNC7_9BURK
MRFARSMVVAAGLVVVAGAASAQVVEGNEAVRVMPDGTRKVETPPSSAAASKAKPCAANVGCHAGPWHMVEAAGGLRECTEPFARPTTCRESTYGSQQLSRVWVAKRGATWLWCQYPDLKKKCVDMNVRPPLNLPVSAVQ